MKKYHVISAGLCSVALLAAAAQGQGTSDAPWLEQSMEREMDSGVRVNAAVRSAVVFSEVVHTPEALWTRLQFRDIVLEGDSRVRFTSLLDGEVQELDAAGVEMWSNGTAYFNGDTVLVELIAAPNTRNNRLVLGEVEFQTLGANQPITLCGICTTDTRVPSSEDWAGRLGPGMCTASVINQNSCMVSAGHCMSANVVMFQVPNSTAGCNIINSSVSNQFPIVQKVFVNGGVGSDWAVFTTGTNNLNQTIYQRFGEYRPIAQSLPLNGPVQVWGYGASKTCTLTHTQQRSQGNIVTRMPLIYTHTADTTGGNSGSALMHNDEIIGIVTHCPCPNVAQRIDTSAFAEAILDLCPNPAPSNNSCSTTLVVGEGDHPFDTEFATTTGPAEPDDCTFFGDGQIQNDIWFGHVAQCDGNLTISICQSNYTSKLAVYGFTCPSSSGTVLACDVNSCPNNRPTVTIPVQQGQGYRIRIGGHNGTTGTGILSISCDPASNCPSDLTGDDIVGVADMLQLMSAWGSCPGCTEDLNGDGEVSVGDLLILLSNWGPCA